MSTSLSFLTLALFRWEPCAKICMVRCASTGHSRITARIIDSAFSILVASVSLDGLDQLRNVSSQSAIVPPEPKLNELATGRNGRPSLVGGALPARAECLLLSG